jgi:hypothetical protein
VASDRFPFWTRDIGAHMPIASALAALTLGAMLWRRDRRSAFWLAVAVSGIAAAWIGRLHTGAYDNIALPAFLSLALLAGMACASVPERLTTTQRTLVRIGIAVLYAIQLGGLRYSISRQVPSADEVNLARRLGEVAAPTAGEVFVPAHSFVPTPQGPVMHAHTWAVRDVLRGGDTASVDFLKRDIENAFSHGKYRAIVLDNVDLWMEPELDENYRLRGPVLGFEELWTKTGKRTRPRAVYLPITEKH